MKTGDNIFKNLIFSDNEIDDDLLDAAIKAGCHEHIKNSNSDSSKKDKVKVVFSDDFEKKMKNIIRNFSDEDKFLKRKNRWHKASGAFVKLSACFAWLMIISILTITSSKALQSRFMNMYVEAFDIKTDYEFSFEEEIYQGRSTIERFTYIPPGFELQEEFDGEEIFFAIFENDDEKYINLQVLGECSSSVDSEDAEYTVKKIGEYTCDIYIEHEEKRIIFVDEDKGFIIISNIEMNELEKIIKNIK